MKFISLIFMMAAIASILETRGCPTCIGTEHRENTPAFFSKEFYQPGKSYATAHTQKPAIKPMAQAPDKEEADQAASMAAVLNDAL
jgi:hypothetical protein